MKKRIWQAVFLLYSGVMLWLLFHRTGYVDGIPYVQQMKWNLVPFHTIKLFWRLLDDPTYRISAIVNLCGNVILFVPLGYMLPKVFGCLDAPGKTLLTAGILILTVELTQLLTLLGTCDIDDLLLNLLGTAMGYGSHVLCRRD